MCQWRARDLRVPIFCKPMARESNTPKELEPADAARVSEVEEGEREDAVGWPDRECLEWAGWPAYSG